MSGYTPDEKLRVEQLTKLRRQWLKDQELSPREPVLPAKPLGPIAKFWAGFLEPKSLWRLYTYKAYRGGVFTLTRYHVSERPYGIVELKPRLFPGDTILETGEVVPELPESHGHH
uniref:NADH dehydrogenase [ubiquinone] 1 beta subcomplex subunit 6 n=1 Tax=Labrus bergylta TaxID=56723 RepID=A0A3Q3G429_9LABR